MLNYCIAERMSLSELARVDLPGAEHNFSIYRDFFRTEADFLNCVRAFHLSGQIPMRSDETYRLSDAYRLPSLVAGATRVQIGKSFSASPGNGLHFFPSELDDTWWEPILGLIAGRAAFRRTCREAAVRDPATDRLLRTLPTKSEHDAEIERVRIAILGEEQQLMDSLPSDSEWWRTRLQAHATLVKRLGEGRRVKLARLCAYHLDVASILAERRLGISRRALRLLVGIGSRSFKLVVGRPPIEEAEFLLTEASYSLVTRVHDRAIDALEETLADYNAAAVPELRLDPSDVQNFIDHMHQAGLDDWATQLVIETWDIEVLIEMSPDQSISMAYSRFRVLCALLEEALRTFAELTTNADFIGNVEKKGTLSPRLREFLGGPAGKTQPVPAACVKTIGEAYAVFPPIGSVQIETSLDGLCMPAGEPPSLPGPDSAHVLAGLVFIRNLTSHRYPIVLPNGRADWFDGWGGHLAAVNRTIAWSGLTLWALTKHFR